MSISISIHKAHRQHTNGNETVEVKGINVKECLIDLIKQYPALEKELFKSKTILKPIIEIYINMESAYPDELSKPIKDGDKIHLTVMLAGG